MHWGSVESDLLQFCLNVLRSSLKGLLFSEKPCADRYIHHGQRKGLLSSKDRVLLFNTGSGLKYTDVIAEAMGLKRPAPESQQVFEMLT